MTNVLNKDKVDEIYIAVRKEYKKKYGSKLTNLFLYGVKENNQIVSKMDIVIMENDIFPDSATITLNNNQIDDIVRKYKLEIIVKKVKRKVLIKRLLKTFFISKFIRIFVPKY